MIRLGLLVVFALTSCAPTTREGWLTDLSVRSPGLCWWQNARWEDRGTLLVRGTGEPFARARARWALDSWRGASISAALRRAGPLVLLQGKWTGPGLTLEADVDVSAQPVFRSYQSNRVGPAAVLLKGAHVRVSDALSGRVLVTPAEESLRPFRPEQRVGLELGCDELTLYANLESGGDEARRLLALSGFRADAPERWVPEHLSLSATALPGGPSVGRFVADDVPVRGFVVEERGDQARLVVPTPAGLVWVGWVPGEGLQAPQGPPPESIEPKERPVLLDESRDWRSCSDSELPLSVESHGKLIQVGTLARATAFSVAGRRGDHREVTLGVEWLDLEPGVRLLVPDRAKDCPRLRLLGAR